MLLRNWRQSFESSDPAILHPSILGVVVRPLDENESDAIVTLVDSTGPTAKHCSVDDLEAREVFDLVFSVNDELNWEVVVVTDDTEV